MTTQARIVLEDCRGALADLHLAPQGMEWRRRWVAALVLLRTVGYVLRTVDGAADKRLETVIRKHWERLDIANPKHSIYWDFIKAERDNIVHSYKIGAGINVTIQLRGAVVRTSASPESYTYSSPAIYEYVMNTGPFKGRDQRELVQEAIDWWDAFLADIERELAAD